MRRSVESPRRELRACQERGRVAARMQEGGREGWGCVCVIFWAFAICTIWSVIWVFVGFFLYTRQGTNVASVEQLGLMDVLHMQSVSQHSSLDHANSTEALCRGVHVEKIRRSSAPPCPEYLLTLYSVLYTVYTITQNISQSIYTLLTLILTAI